MATFRNLTPHPLDIRTVDGEVIVLPPEDTPARVQVLRLDMDVVPDGQGHMVHVVTETPGEIVGLPNPEPGTWLIVSRMVADAAPHRRDLLVPGALVRDDEGQVIGCEHLVARF